MNIQQKYMILIAVISLPLSKIWGHILTLFWGFDYVHCCEIFGHRLNWKILIGTVIFAISAFFCWERYQFGLNQTHDRTFHFFEGSALDFYRRTYGNELALKFIFGLAFGVAMVGIILWEILLN